MLENKEKIHWMKLAFQLSQDLILIALGSFSLVLLAEGVLPGIATSHLPWRYWVVFLLFTLSLAIFLGKKTGLKSLETAFFSSKKTTFLSGSLLLLVFLGNFWKGSWESFLLAVLSLATVSATLFLWREK